MYNNGSSIDALSIFTSPFIFKKRIRRINSFDYSSVSKHNEMLNDTEEAKDEYKETNKLIEEREHIRTTNEKNI